MLTRRSVIAALCGATQLPCPAQEQNLPLEVPARVDSTGRMMIEVHIDQADPVWMALDTLAGPKLSVSRDKAAEIGLTPLLRGNNREPEALVTVEIASARLNNQTLALRPQATGVDGAIGTAILGSAVIELDYVERSARFHPAATFRYQGSGNVIPFEIWNGAIVVAGLAMIGQMNPVPMRLAVATNMGPFDAYFTREFDAELRRMDRRLPWRQYRAGPTWCRIDGLAVGTRSAQVAPTVQLLPRPSQDADVRIIGMPDGMLGTGFLRRYRIFLDYRRKQMILETPRERGTAV